MCFYRNLRQYADVALLLLRLAIAFVFLYHGFQKWQFWSATPEGMTQSMFIVLRFLAIAEPLAGLALLLGALTQVAAAGLVLVMVGALWMKITSGNPFPQWELEFLLLVSNIVLIIEGPGQLSVDHAYGKRK